MPASDYGGLDTLKRPDGTPPTTRHVDALACQSTLRRYIDADWQFRGKKRSLVQGLIDGNPPYSAASLAASAKRDRCNVNWRTPAAYVDSAVGIFYDLATEAPTELSIWLDSGKQHMPGEEPAEGEWMPSYDQVCEWEKIMSEEAHEVLNSDPRWDWLRHCSQRQMVIHGCGPLIHEDDYHVMPRFVKAGDLKVDENAESNPYYWQECFVLVDYTPDQLYNFIKDESAATKKGWNVEYTKAVIMNALPKSNTAGVTWDWEYWQQRFKQNSSSAYQGEKVVPVAHAYWREFDGKITHAILEQSIKGDSSTDSKTSFEYMFFDQSRFDSWCNVINPMYYAAGNGQHYTVEGLGVKMYAAMTYENRLRCKLADVAMAPQVVFRPTSESASSFNLTAISDYAKMSAGWEMIQLPIQGNMRDGMAMLTELGQLSANNLQAYRQGWNRAEGNPPTARQVQVEQQQQYAVQGTQISHYYKQLDQLLAEMVRRLCLTTTTDELAKKFKERCERRRVPKEAFKHVRKVEANRVAGQGSASLRQQALDKLMSAITMYDEESRSNILCDWTAAHTGQRSVRRYCVSKKTEKMGTEQQVEAQLQVAAMKVGVPPIISPEQNPVVFAGVFLASSMQEIQTVQQGANPLQVLNFLHLAGPAAAQHLERFKDDPTRKGIHKQLQEMLKAVAKATDQIAAKVQQMAAQHQQQQPGANGSQLPPDVQQKLAIEDAKGQLKLKQMALSHQQRLQQRKEQHEMQIAAEAQRTQAQIASMDATTAAEIRRGGLRSLGEQ